MANRARRTHPSPASFTQEVEDIIDSLDDLIPLYSEADEYVYDRRDRAQGVTGRISGVGVSDPTGATITEQEGNKRQMKRVMADLQRVKAIIDGTEKNGWDGIREKLLRIYDPPEYEPLASFRSTGELSDRHSQAVAAKARRFAARLRRWERNARRAS